VSLGDYLVELTVTAPSAGHQISFQLPAGLRHRLLSWRFAFTFTANVAYAPAFTIADAQGNEIYASISNDFEATSAGFTDGVLGINFERAPYNPSAAQGSNQSVNSILLALPPFFLPVGAAIGTNFSSLHSTDSFTQLGPLLADQVA
jgi:hypothetical protein